MIPQRTIDSLDRYVNEGIPTGGFLHAVLMNDLMESLGRADQENLHNIVDICRHVYSRVPMQARNSEKNIQEWIDHRGLAGLQERAEWDK